MVYSVRGKNSKGRNRLNRPELCTLICKRLSIKANSDTKGYFDTWQLRQILDYIIKTQGDLSDDETTKPTDCISSVRV